MDRGFLMPLVTIGPRQTGENAFIPGLADFPFPVNDSYEL
jgi:hypothetical protein